MQICDYSSLIFVGNTTVLLILALTTDYWEYRKFNIGQVVTSLAATNEARVEVPVDTNSYIQIRTFKNISQNTSAITSDPFSESVYHAPAFMVKRTVWGGKSERGNQSKDTHHSFIQIRHEINIFQQYGNLFRDCDDLERVVRNRIGLQRLRPAKCLYFLYPEEQTNFVHTQAPALATLEPMASACALACILLISLGFVAGWYGTFSSCHRVSFFQIASVSSLCAGFCLTLGIALFHGKCYVLRKLKLFSGEEFPVKDLLERSRITVYGWSFSLAWLCVFCCYISAYVWLVKAQGPREWRGGQGAPGSVALQKTSVIARWSPKECSLKKH
ncbi:hypothetical protein MAR_009337 [Mya arenaria]|uniref:Uncharacterized protein n=1 Tax=Mya arenaria TaxID=6604 RepID=A0ABY7E2W8_MYAAR|nr:hypothetical protein MAR_009337 [Mya arenaria]